jgi:hypothetical protein
MPLIEHLKRTWRRRVWTLPPNRRRLGRKSGSWWRNVAAVQQLEDRALLAATPIASGQIISGTISSGSPQATYTFSAAAGTTFEVTVGDANAASKLRPELDVIDENGNMIGQVRSDSATNTATNTSVRFSHAVTSADEGSYTIVVQDIAEGGPLSQTGDFNVELAAVPAPQALDAYGGDITSGQIKAGNIDRLGKMEIYTFSVAPNASFELTLGDGDAFSALRPDLSVFDSSGTLLAERKSDTASNTATNTSVRYSSQALANGGGVYTAIVQDIGGGTNGSQLGTYNLELAESPSEQPGSAYRGIIVSGETANGTIGSLGQMDIYTFSLAAHASFELTLADSDATSAVRPDLTVYDSNGNTIGETTSDTASNTATDTSVRLSSSAPSQAASVYTVVVQDIGGGTNGSQLGGYNLELALAPASQPPIAVSPDQDKNGGVIEPGGLVNGNINRLGNMDIYSLFAFRTDIIQLTMSAPTGSAVRPEIDLYDPNGNLVGHRTGSSEVSVNYNVPQDPKLLPDPSGLYTIIVQDIGGGSSGSQTGGYRLTLDGDFALQLAELSSNVYRGSQGAGGYTSVLSNVQTDPSNGFAANDYISEDGKQVVIAYRGTVLSASDAQATYKDLTADKSFVTGVPDSTLISMVMDATSFLEAVRADHPDAVITLTGHSLGGAIAQMEGAAAGLDTIAFNAPGAMDVFAQLLLLKLSPLPTHLLGTSSIDMNIRLFGDQVSLAGSPIGTQITLNDPPGTVFSSIVNPIHFFIGNTKTFLGLHLIDAVISQIAANASIVSNANEPNITGVLENAAGEEVLEQLTDSAIVRLAFNVTSLVDGQLVDPDPGRDFVLSADPGSPGITSISLPTFPGVAQYRVRYFSSSDWSAFQVIPAGTTDSFGASTDRVEFQPLDSNNAGTLITEPFYFGLTFDSLGSFGATVLESTKLFPAPSVSDVGGIYNGNPFPATATIAGVIAGVDDTPGDSLEQQPLILTYYVGSTATGTPLTDAPKNAGTYTVVASFPGSEDYTSASQTVTFTIAPATPILAVVADGGPYDDSAYPAAATIAGVVSGVDTSPSDSLQNVDLSMTYYAGSDPNGQVLSGPPTAAGTYTVVASFAGSLDYVSVSDSKIFVITQLDANLSLGDAGGTYNGHAFPATATVAGRVAGVDDTPGDMLEGQQLALTYYSGSTATGTPLLGPPSNAGTYTVIASFAGSTDYLAASDLITFDIAKATPRFTLNDAGGTADANPFPATATIAGVVAGVDNTPGSTLEQQPLTLAYYAGSTATGTPLVGAPSDPGTYTVVASFAGSQDYVSANSTPVTFAISPVTLGTPTIHVTDAGSTYTGNPFVATATAIDSSQTPISGTFTYTYYVGSVASGTASSTPPTNAGAYTVVANFTSSDPDYADGQSDPLTFTISEATPSVSVSDSGGIYNANAFPATATVSGIDNAPANSLEGIGMTFAYYSGSTASGTPLSGPPTAAGMYTVLASFAGSVDYTSASNSKTFTISTATPTVAAQDAGGVANGSAFPATGTVTGVSGVAGATLEGIGPTFTYYSVSTATGTPLSGPPSASGTYTVVASFAGSQDYAAAQSGPVTFSVTANPTTITARANGPFTVREGNSIRLSATASDTLRRTLTYSWDVNGDGVFGDATGASPTLTWAQLVALGINDGPATFNVQVRVTNGLTTAFSTTTTLTVTAVAPTATFSNSGSIVQGGTTERVTFTRPTDPSPTETRAGFLYSYDFNNDGVFEITNSTSASALVPASYLATTGSHVVHARISDEGGKFTDYRTTVNVTASRPSVTITSNVATSVPGEPVPLVIRATDTSADAQGASFTYNISFGDGKTTTQSAIGPLAIGHVYTRTGTFTVRVTATDEFGHTSSTATRTVRVVAAAVETDPFDATKSALFVGGTSGNDTVAFTRSGGRIAVSLNRTSQGTFSASGPLIVFGQGGTDSAQENAQLGNALYALEDPNQDGIEISLLDSAIHAAGLSAALEVLNA